jgi:hypothetical protein
LSKQTDSSFKKPQQANKASPKQNTTACGEKASSKQSNTSGSDLLKAKATAAASITYTVGSSSSKDCHQSKVLLVMTLEHLPWMHLQLHFSHY